MKLTERGAMPATVRSSDHRKETRHRNEILLVGVLQEAPAERVLADGQTVATFRLDVRRDDDGGRDSIECTAAGPHVVRAAAKWTDGDVVEVTGALRRRFYRAGAASRPFVVVDVDRARRVNAATRRRKSG